ncbi:hypothetical protein [Aurantibacillus circumpalustris]|uniref:hypothetical protein n=1 Tax=Aurantibacillus circumpalustris TaxID=3036359 RepID=UPI00295B89D8|nr:hypothetical protein [Aurantibacillus circumpalustris]
MEPTNYDQFMDESNGELQRPDFLKIICILSFVACGLMILICCIGAMALSLDATTIEKLWEKVVESNPQFDEIEPMQFVHSFGMVCVYTLISNIFSLIGVIMMWRLEKIGFVVYAIAELSTHFYSFDMGTSSKNQSSIGLIIGVLIDLIFIAMYFANLKHMNKKNNNTFIQSGS